MILTMICAMLQTDSHGQKPARSSLQSTEASLAAAAAGAEESEASPASGKAAARGQRRGGPGCCGPAAGGQPTERSVQGALPRAESRHRRIDGGGGADPADDRQPRGGRPWTAPAAAGPATAEARAAAGTRRPRRGRTRRPRQSRGRRAKAGTTERDAGRGAALRTESLRPGPNARDKLQGWA